MKPWFVFLGVAAFNLYFGIMECKIGCWFPANLFLVPVFLYLAATWKGKQCQK